MYGVSPKPRTRHRQLRTSALPAVLPVCAGQGHATWTISTRAERPKVPGVTAAPHPRHDRTGQSFADASPAEVRAALIPEEADEFDVQWREVMARATETLDLTEVFTTLDSWRRVARLTAATGAQAHRAMYRRAAAALGGEQLPADAPLSAVKAKLGL